MSVSLTAVQEREYDDFFDMVELYDRELEPYEPRSEDAVSMEHYRRAVLGDTEGRELLWIVADGRRAGF